MLNYCKHKHLKEKIWNFMRQIIGKKNYRLSNELSKELKIIKRMKKKNCKKSQLSTMLQNPKRIRPLPLPQTPQRTQNLTTNHLNFA